MEELLNKLIQKGWRPFGEGCHRSPYKRVGIHKNYNKERTYVLFYSDNHTHWKVLRQVVSAESGLWQFVCEKKIVNSKTDKFQTIYREKKYDDERDHDFSKKIIDNCDIRYQYRLIESALCDEDKLEEFLLDNIKV